MDSIEKIGKTVDDAINDALRALDITLEEAEVEVLDEGTKGILGIGGRPVKVLVKRKLEPSAIAKNFLKEIFLNMGIIVDIETEMKNERMVVNLAGENMGVLIGKRGQTLDSLQYLTSLVVNKGSAPYVSITLDTENYRARRRKTLESLAIGVAKKAAVTGRSVQLEPMNPYERQIIHSFLQNDKYVKTHSSGNEPHRYIVVSPNRTKNY